jgi:hypothetical protein
MLIETICANCDGVFVLVCSGRLEANGVKTSPQHAERLKRKGYARSEVYRCTLCGNFHVTTKGAQRRAVARKKARQRPAELELFER